MHSNLLNVSSKNFAIIVIGAIHHDFIFNSFYSSMSLYKLTNASDIQSGVGIISVIDNEQRSSANDFMSNLHFHLNLNLDHFVVIQFAASCLPLPSSALCKTFLFSKNEILYVLGRTYANPAGPLPSSLFNNVVLYVEY